MTELRVLQALPTSGAPRDDKSLVLAGVGGVAAEEAVGLPLRALGIVGDGDHEAANHFFVLRGGGKIDRLIEIVGGGVVAIGKPVFEELLLLVGVGIGRDAHGERGNAVADEVVLIAADKSVA